MKKLVLFFDITKDSVIDEIQDFLLQNCINVIESRVFFTVPQTLFVISVALEDYTKVFILFFNEVYLTNKIFPKNKSIDECLWISG